MTLLFIEYKDGDSETYEIKSFKMSGSKIQIERTNDIFFLDYAEIENIKIIDSEIIKNESRNQ